MDAVRVALFRDVLAGTEWCQATHAFATSLRASVTRAPATPGGLLLVGSEAYEPWHLAAHLDDEAAWSGLPALSPTLVRFRVPAGAPDHLSMGLGRLEAARRGETVFVVTPDRAGPSLLERVDGARRAGATVLAMDSGDPGLRALAHDALTVPADAGPGDPGRPRVGMDLLQHLVSAAAGENSRPGPPGPRRVPGARRRDRFRDRLSRLAEQLTNPPPTGW